MPLPDTDSVGVGDPDPLSVPLPDADSVGVTVVDSDPVKVVELVGIVTLSLREADSVGVVDDTLSVDAELVTDPEPVAVLVSGPIEVPLAVETLSVNDSDLVSLLESVGVGRLSVVPEPDSVGVSVVVNVTEPVTRDDVSIV